MPNTTITYEAIRALKSGVTSGTIVDDLELSLVQFDRSLQTGESAVDMINGDDYRTLHYIRKQYDCALGVVPAAMTEDLDQFFLSVIAGEEFTMTNPDEGDRVMTCKLVQGSKPGRNRTDKKNLNRFRHQFAVQEVS